MTDVTVENHGSIFLFFLHTLTALRWVQQWVDEEWTMEAGPVIVEHRYAQDMAAGMLNDGLEVV